MTALPALFLAGLPGAGKSTVGRALAARLDRPFFDLDAVVAARAGASIAAIFAAEGEAGFRAHEAAAVAALVDGPAGRDGDGRQPVVALGGGTLVDAANRAALAAAGLVVVLDAPLDVLAARLTAAPGERPLLGDGAASIWPRLARLHARRRSIHGALPWHVATAGRDVDAVAAAVAALAGAVAADARRRTTRAVWVGGRGGGTRVLIGHGLLGAAGAIAAAEGDGAGRVVVSDAHVAPLHAPALTAALAPGGGDSAAPGGGDSDAPGGGGGDAHDGGAPHGTGRDTDVDAAGEDRPARIVVPSGEAAKTPAQLAALWDGLHAAGLDRTGQVWALGGGALTDVAGFAAATFLRGVAWTALPTTLLGMVDAAIGGKTAVDLAAGKNLAGAFHAPRRVIADLDTLSTLPAPVFTAGLAEVVKAAVVGDAALLAALEARVAGGHDAAAGAAGWPPDALAEVVARAAAVKAAIVARDPRERAGGRRVQLNLGHTFAHGIEHASGHAISHGAAVAVGLVWAARLAARHGVLADPALPERLRMLLAALGLPTDLAAAAASAAIAPPPPAAVRAAMAADKKRAAGRLRFVLPVAIADVRLFDDVAESDVAAVIGG